MLDAEKQYLDDGALEKFTERVERIKKTVVDFVRKKVSEGKRFHAMGASTKGNTLLQYFGLGSAEIEAAAEVNPEKYGLVTAGTGIPIISQEKSLATEPDYYLVLPWHFIAFLREKHAGYALVVPLPEPAVFTAGSELPLE
jgi:NDP-4-keto-2,6-dideoxyhexose 3-C-methyltransferase